MKPQMKKQMLRTKKENALSYGLTHPTLGQWLQTWEGNFWKLWTGNSPPGNPLHQIFNRNKVKMSYRCTPNLDRKIKGHNTKILNTVNNQEEMEPRKTCNCRKKDECPVGNNCLQEGVVYQATIVTVGKRMSVQWRIIVCRRG